MNEVEVTNQKELDDALKTGYYLKCMGDACFKIYGSSQVRARDSSQVRARDSSQVTAYDSSQVTAYGSSQVRACDSSQVRALSKYVVISNHGADTTINGGTIIEIIKPKNIKDWCGFYGVKYGKVITLFKAVDKNYISPHGQLYIPGTTPSADDWDGGVLECGGGLHFSPTPTHALGFNNNAVKFIACPIAIIDAVVHANANYPEKIKAKGCCASVWECDIDGIPISKGGGDE